MGAEEPLSSREQSSPAQMEVSRSLGCTHLLRLAGQVASHSAHPQAMLPWEAVAGRLLPVLQFQE